MKPPVPAKIIFPEGFIPVRGLGRPNVAVRSGAVRDRIAGLPIAWIEPNSTSKGAEAVSNGKRWIYIGCGGCLGVVVLLALLAGGALFYLRSVVQNIQADMEAIQTELRELGREYPFETPEGNVIGEEQFERFLDVRTRLAAKAEEEFRWILDLVDQSANQGDVSFWDVIRNLTQLPGNLAAIGRTQVEALADNAMSPNEYRYLTERTAAEIASWRGAGEELAPLADQYLRPLRDLQDGIENQRQRNPNSDIDPGPFDYNEFMGRVGGATDPDHPNRGLIRSHMDTILSSTAAIYVDAIVLDNEWVTEPRTAAEPAPTPEPPDGGGGGNDVGSDGSGE